MKKIFIIFLILLSLDLFAKRDRVDNFELGRRNIKLGNSYREAKNYDFAARFLNDGMKIVERRKDFEGKYWLATGYEYLGYLYRDMNMPDEAKKNFNKALNIFRQIIRQEDGSPQAMIEILNTISRISENETLLSNNKLSNQVSLSFSNSKLKELPAGIPDNVGSLILRNNRFTNFPDGITKFSKLEYLDLSNNRLRSIPENIGLLKNLHYLDLSNNRIRNLAGNIGELEQLRELNLENNRLKTIPSDICRLSNLRLLNLKGNKLNFDEVLNLVRCLQNTNIIFDEYQKVEEEEIITGED